MATTGTLNLTFNVHPSSADKEKQQLAAQASKGPAKPGRLLLSGEDELVALSGP